MQRRHHIAVGHEVIQIQYTRAIVIRLVLAPFENNGIDDQWAYWRLSN